MLRVHIFQLAGHELSFCNCRLNLFVNQTVKKSECLSWNRVSQFGWRRESHFRIALFYDIGFTSCVQNFVFSMIPCQNHTLGRPLTLLSSVEVILKHAIERGAHKGLNRNLSVIHNFQTRLDLSCLLSFRLVIFWNRREFYGVTAISCIGSHHSFSAPTKAKSRHSLHCTLVKHTLLFVHSKGVL